MTQFTASLWGDEAWAATLAVKPIWQIITTVARDTSPPFYYLCEHGWMQIFGTSEIAIRALSFLFFLATAATVYLIGKFLWDKKTGWLAAGMSLANPFLFTYAFEGRMYAALLFTTTLSVYFFLKKQRFGFILATAAALYSHHFAIFVVFWELVWRSVENRQRLFKKTRLRTIAANCLASFSDFMIIGLLYLPWAYPLYYQTSLVAGGFWLGKPTLETLGETVRKFLVGSGQEPIRQIAWAAVAVTFLSRKWFKNKFKLVEPGKTLFLLGWFLSPLLLTFSLSQVMQSIFFDRYMLVAIPGIILLVVSQRRRLSLVPIFTAVLLLGILNVHYFTHPTKRPFREFAQIVKREAAGFPLINFNAAAHHLWESKYYGLQAPIYSPQELPFYVGTALMGESDVIKTLPETDGLGVITSAPAQEIEIPGFRVTKTIGLGDLNLILVEK